MCTLQPIRNLAIRRDDATTGRRHRKEWPMHKESSRTEAASDPRLERAIVLALLDDDDVRRRWSRAELSEDLGADQGQLQGALDGLLAAGVICAAEEHLWPSAAARRLDELELIGI
jgi:hypothetical protein